MAGAISRLVPYVGNRALWYDEATIALLIARHSFSGLLHHIDSGQRGPIVFLMLEKAATQVAGLNEFALRFFPLLAAMASLVLFYQLARRCLRPRAALIALALFALSTRLVYYASEVKPYSGDVAATLAIILFALTKAQRRAGAKALLGLGGIGALCILTSYASIFVVAGCGLVLFCFEWSRGRRKIASQLALIAAGWAALFLIDYFLVVGPVKDYLRNLWQPGFAPSPLLLIGAASWLARATLSPLTTATLGLAPFWLAAAAFGIGCVWLFLADRWLLALLLSPAAATLLAAILHQYPFSDRLILFLVPLYLMVMGAGLDFVWDSLWPMGPVVAVTLAILLLFPAAQKAATSLVHPPEHEEIKLILDYVIENRKSGDLLYLSDGAGQAFDFYTHYSGKYNFNNMVIVRGSGGTTDVSKYETSLRTLLGHPRVWIVMSHYGYAPNPLDPRVNEREIFHSILERMGKCLSQVSAVGAQGYLYDLSAPAAGASPARGGQ